MPKVVDHEARRSELLTAVRRVIARQGLDETTHRTIAEETGWSTGTLAHYFTNKDELIHETLVHVHAAQARRLHARATDGSPRELLRETIFTTLPLDAERREEAIVEVNFWPRALHNEALSAVQRADFDRWTKSVRELVVQAAEAGQIRAGVDARLAASVIVAAVDGLQLEAALYPRRFSKSAVTALVDALLDAYFV